MKKRLLLSLFAVLATVGVSAHSTGEFAYTTSQRFKMTGDNMLVNGQFNPDATGWTDAAGENVSLTGWSVEQAAGPNGEVNALLFTGTESTASLCQVVELAPSTTYAVSFWIKGETAGNLTSTLIFVNGDGTREKVASTAEAPVIDVMSSCNYSDEWTEVTAVVTTPVGAADPEDATVTYIATPSLVINFSGLGAGVMVADFSVNEAMEVYDIRIIERKIAYARLLMEEASFNIDDAKAERGYLDENIQMVESLLDGPDLEDPSTAEGALQLIDDALESFLGVTSQNLASQIKTFNFASLANVGRGRNFTGMDNVVLSGGNWGHLSDAECLMSAIQTGQYGHTATFTVKNDNFPAGRYFFSAEIRNANTGKSSWPCPEQVFNLRTDCKMWIGNDTVMLNDVYGENYQRFYMIANVEKDGEFTASVYWPGTTNGEDVSKNNGGAFYIRNVELRGFGDIITGAEHFAAWKTYKTQWDAAVNARYGLYDRIDNANYPWGQDSLKNAMAIWEPYYLTQRDKGWITADGEDAGVASTEELNDWAKYQGVELWNYDENGNPTTKKDFQLVRGFQNANTYAENYNQPITDLAKAIDAAKVTRNKGTNATGDRDAYKTAIETAIAALKEIRSTTTDETRDADIEKLNAALEALNAATEAFLASAEIKPIVDIDFSDENGMQLYEPSDDEIAEDPTLSSYYFINGAAGQVTFPVNAVSESNTEGTGFTLGYGEEYKDALRVGNGEATVAFGEPGNMLKVEFDFYLGNLIKYYAFADLRNENNERVAGFRYSKYDANVDYNDFNNHVGTSNGGDGMDIRQFALGIGSSSASNASIYATGALNHFELIIDYTGEVPVLKGTLTNGNGKVTGGAAMPARDGITDQKAVKFVFGSNYTNQDRRCWFDNLKITRYLDAPADFEEDILESPWAEHTNAVKTVKANANSSAIYTISGMRVNNASQKGIYIQNGKKFVVK